MRDYLIAAIVLASLPVGILRPYYGVLIYAWVSYMYPHLLGWSFVRTWPVGKIAGISTIVGAVVQHDGTFLPLKERETLLMVLLLLVFCVSTVFAFYPQDASGELLNMGKIILMSLITSTLLTDRERLRKFFLVVAFSIGFYGVKGGIFGIRTGGEQLVWGPEPSIISANNALGVALNMCLPIFWYLAKDTPQRWLKTLLQVCFVLTIPAIMFTYSRASALALAFVCLLIVLKSSKKILVLVLLVLMAPVAVGFLPDKWIGRQRSTLTYEEDSSAMSRFGEWEYCWRMAKDRPLTGGGFLFYSMETYAMYYPEFLNTYGRTWNSHSIYFGMLAAHGFPGLLIFLAMIGACLLSLLKIKRDTTHREDLRWLGNYSDIVMVSFGGFLVNGAFNNMEYFDLVYHWVGVVATLKVIARDKLAAGPAEEAEALLIQETESPLVASAEPQHAHRLLGARQTTLG